MSLCESAETQMMLVMESVRQLRATNSAPTTLMGCGPYPANTFSRNHFFALVWVIHLTLPWCASASAYSCFCCFVTFTQYSGLSAFASAFCTRPYCILIYTKIVSWFSIFKALCDEAASPSSFCCSFLQNGTPSSVDMYFVDFCFFS
jgi:hypothetical protein